MQRRQHREMREIRKTLWLCSRRKLNWIFALQGLFEDWYKYFSSDGNVSIITVYAWKFWLEKDVSYQYIFYGIELSFIFTGIPTKFFYSQEYKTNKKWCCYNSFSMFAIYMVFFTIILYNPKSIVWRWRR